MKLINISTPKYPNTFTMVDDADFDRLNQWKWRKIAGGYAVRWSGKRESRRLIFMHVEILKPPPGMKGDHRFGNRLDNRRENLRICNDLENARNMKPRVGRALPKGVSRNKKTQRFYSRIRVNYTQIRLGTFRTVPEAEAAYIEASKKYHGDFSFQEPKITLA